MLVWDETDFITCLETVPVVAEYGVSHSFSVADDGVRLEIVVHQYDGDVSIRLFRDGTENTLFDLTLIDCSGVRFVNDKAGERLEFAPAKCFGSRYDGLSPIPFGISVSVKPGIRIPIFGGTG
jgi:hypothetical protein